MTGQAKVDSVLRLCQVSKAYRDGDTMHGVLREVDLSVQENEFVILLGRSGSGKSTLLNIMGGIDLPDSGRVEVAGQVLNDMSETRRTEFRRHHLGFIFQFFNLVPTLTVEENLLLPLELIGRVSAPQRQEVLAVLERLSLLHCRRRFPEQLSGGEQQRVAVLRALVHRPRLVLADEPTGNLDDETSAELLNLIQDLRRERPMTLFMVTHNRDLLDLADRALTMHDGRLQVLTG